MARPASDPARTGQLDALTGLRFVVALHVVLFHLTAGYLAHAPAPIRDLFMVGPESVTIFFILSGFVLAYTYRDRPATDPRPFWWARFARIYPVYILALVVGLPMFLGHPPQYDRIQLETTDLPVWGEFNTHWMVAISSVLLLQAWLPPAVLKWNYPGWSLSVEAFFYSLFPSLSAAVARQSPRGLRNIALGAWLTSVGMTAGWWVVSQQLPPGEVLSAWWGHVLNYNPLIRLPEFVIGIAIGFYFMDGRAPARPARNAALAASAVIVIWMVHWSKPSSYFENSLLIPIYATLILSLAYGEGLLGRVLASRPMVSLGKASYSLYLTHAPIIFLGHRLWPKRAAGTHYLQVVLALGATALFSVLASLVVYRFVEEPARRQIRRWSERRPEPELSAA